MLGFIPVPIPEKESEMDYKMWSILCVLCRYSNAGIKTGSIENLAKRIKMPLHRFKEKLRQMERLGILEITDHGIGIYTSLQGKLSI